MWSIKCLQRGKRSTQARKAGPAGATATCTESGMNVNKLKTTVKVQSSREYVALS